MFDSIYSFLDKVRINIYLVLFLGFLIRIVGISVLPVGLNQDEASIGYEAYSLIKTGLDRHGFSYPVHFVSWGSGQNALYAYLSIPFIKVLGLNAFSVRIVNAIFSCISLLLFFLLFRLLFDNRKALIALLLITISPWSIMAARWGLESNIFPTLFLGGFYFMVLGYKLHQKYFLFSFLVFAISLYSYGTSYLVAPLFLTIVYFYLYLKKNIDLKYLISGLLIFCLLATPVFLFIIINHFDLQSINLFGMVSIPKLDSNRTTVIFNILNGNFVLHLLKNTSIFLSIIFLQTDGSVYNSIPMFGTIYHLSLPFFAIGLIKIIVNKESRNQIYNFGFLCWLLCALILGISTHTNINRINIIFFPLLYFTIVGIFHVQEILPSFYWKYYKMLMWGYYAISFLFFAGYYSLLHNESFKKEFSYGLGDAILFADKLESPKRINISPVTVNMPYIFVCFYTELDPTEFREAVVYSNEGGDDGFRKVVRLNSYSFSDNITNDSTIQIIGTEEFNFNKSKFGNSKKFGNYYICNY